ncbi:MAG: hypothetical protein KJN75_05330, partial [Muriicola sp.]|nr:hypothetical protein [Muriicola sp.]
DNTQSVKNQELNQSFADVLSVQIEGNPNQYSFTVTLRSPDTGCEQYANWWEIITPEGELIYRRILGHSHVNEQPFSRSGGPIQIMEDQLVIVRAHMNNEGYGGESLKGSVSSGFDKIQFEGYEDLAQKDPQPGNCQF